MRRGLMWGRSKGRRTEGKTHTIGYDRRAASTRLILQRLVEKDNSTSLTHNVFGPMTLPPSPSSSRPSRGATCCPLHRCAMTQFIPFGPAIDHISFARRSE